MKSKKTRKSCKVDVIDIIKPFLLFDNPDDFYFLQILRRKKENPEIGSNSRVVKNYFIGSVEYLDKRYNEIKELCHVFNARAALRLNKRSYRKVALKTIQIMSGCMLNNDFQSIRKSYIKACGRGHNSNDKKWLLDIDENLSTYQLLRIKNIIALSNPIEDKLLITLPTANGIHIITKPFDSRTLIKDNKDITIHKDNPINLYIP